MEITVIIIQIEKEGEKKKKKKKREKKVLFLKPLQTRENTPMVGIVHGHVIFVYNGELFG